MNMNMNMGETIFGGGRVGALVAWEPQRQRERRCRKAYGNTGLLTETGKDMSASHIIEQPHYV